MFRSEAWGLLHFSRPFSAWHRVYFVVCHLRSLRLSKDSLFWKRPRRLENEALPREAPEGEDGLFLSAAQSGAAASARAQGIREAAAV